MSKNKSVDAISKQPPVVIERSYRATQEEVWALWTSKEGFESWWGPEGFRADVHTLEAKLHGTLHYDMVADSPEMIATMEKLGRPRSHETHSRFSVFEPFGRLALTSSIDFLPGVEPYENTISVELIASGPTVRMVVTLEAMHSEEFSKMSNEGFTSQLRKLDERYPE